MATEGRHTGRVSSVSSYNKHTPTFRFNILVNFYIFCRYILMAEPDHLIVKPIPNLSRDGRAAAFPFFYIEPQKFEKLLRKFFPENKGPITNIDPIGNSPVIIEKVVSPCGIYSVRVLIPNELSSYVFSNLLGISF
jgi:hypothetical protein